MSHLPSLGQIKVRFLVLRISLDDLILAINVLVIDAREKSSIAFSRVESIASCSLALSLNEL